MQGNLTDAAMEPSSSARRPESSAEDDPPNQAPSTIQERRRPAAPLPAFNFRPAEYEPPLGLPPGSPDSSASSPSKPIRAGGHRRGGSEFIGGDGQTGGPGLMSSSPTKGETSLPLPAPADPSSRRGGRRGHTHRRSGAISSHDLSAVFGIPQPRPAGRAESAPTSPIDSTVGPMRSYGAEPERRGSLNDVPESEEVSQEHPSPRRRQRAPRGPARARVGFSDHIEFIPRPLSTLSSDTASSGTTIRGQNSIAGSMSSLIGGDAFSSDESHSPRQTDENQPIRERPATAEPVMTRRGSVEKKPFGDLRGVLERPRSASQFAGFPVESDARETTKSGVDESAISGAAEGGPFSADVDEPDGIQSETSQPGSVLSRQAQQGFEGEKESVDKSGSILAFESSLDDSSLLSHFENDDILTIVAPSNEYGAQQASVPGSQKAPASPPGEKKYPIIDLDAALGPFNTPKLAGDSEESWDSDGFFARHRIGTGGFLTSGTPYHRRTESAPAAGLNLSRSGLQRWKSSSAMANVFEEDEEEDIEEVKMKDAVRAVGRGNDNAKGDETTTGLVVEGPGSKVVEDSNTGPKPQQAVAQEEGLVAPDQGHHDTLAELKDGGELTHQESGSSTEVGDQLPHEPLENRDDHVNAEDRDDHAKLENRDDKAKLENVRPSHVAKSVETTVPAPGREDAAVWSLPSTQAFAATPFQLDGQSGPLTPSLPASSMVSPEMVSGAFDRTSIATPSVFTSASSFMDERPLNSPLLGEPGPDVRASVDDVPSLTSTNSARTSAVQSYTGPYSSRPRSGEGVGAGIAVRSGSMTSYATEESSQVTPRPPTAPAKRGSLVSLSRLVGGSSASEKSKLSIEQKCPPESPEKGKSDKKGKGLSRIMRFLKPKGSGSGSGSP